MGLDWEKSVELDQPLGGKVKRRRLLGNPIELARLTGWSARTSVAELAV
jgi:hypothetical protein